MLYAYPREFRLQYGAAMRQVFRDRCRELARDGSAGSWLGFGLRSATDWIGSVVRERQAARKTHGTRKIVQEWAVTLLLL